MRGDAGVRKLTWEPKERGREPAVPASFQHALHVCLQATYASDLEEAGVYHGRRLFACRQFGCWLS